ncbi:MAG: 30S ribosomal protein S16 [Chlamydiia bacterium]
MALKIRLRKQGRHNRPCFRLVVTEVGCARDGKYIEMLGWYDPQGTTPANSFNVKGERVLHWINQGAQVSDCAHDLMRRAAPEVVATVHERVMAKREKIRAKRRAR